MTKSKKLIAVLLALVFIASAAVFIYGAAKIGYEKKIAKKWEHIYAVVSHKDEDENGEMVYFIAYYSEKGMFYQPFAKEGVNPGEDVEIYFNPENPEEYYVVNDVTKPPHRLLKNIGLLAMLMCLTVCFMIFFPIVKKDRLIKGNKWAMCKVKKVEKAGRRAVRIYCDSSKFKKRKGRPFVSDPVKGELPKNIKESSLMVYYSEKYPFLYYVEIDKL